MEGEKKWYQSKVFILAATLVVGSLGFIGVSIGYFNATDLQSAQTVYPEVENAVNMIRAGQVVSGVSVIISILIGYFRLFSTTKLISGFRIPK